MLCEHGRCGYFEPMARAGRTEPDSVSIWLKLSAEDAARMTQVLTRPEFALPAWKEREVKVPPVGTVSFATHAAPVRECLRVCWPATTGVDTTGT